MRRVARLRATAQAALEDDSGAAGQRAVDVLDLDVLADALHDGALLGVLEADLPKATLVSLTSLRPRKTGREVRCKLLVVLSAIYFPRGQKCVIFSA